MRGPGYKVSGDVRRTWRCPKCGLERKFSGEITTLICRCHDGTWMQIVAERPNAPRPLQRPSDVERRPIDFGIEPPPPQAARPEATIIKPAISKDPETESPPIQNEPEPMAPQTNHEQVEEEWGEGIL